FHLRGDRRQRVDHVADVLEAFAPRSEPLGMDARARQRLDQLVLRHSVVEGEPWRPLALRAAVLAALALRAEHPAAPWPGGEARVELAGSALEVAHDEADLEGREPF